MKTDLPPEAFTKETLQEAFNWLQTQPEALRESIHTPERLVSLYRKSQRLNDQDAPVSSKKFIDDLKNLATSLDQFGHQQRTTRSFNFSEATTQTQMKSEQSQQQTRSTQSQKQYHQAPPFQFQRTEEQNRPSNPPPPVQEPEEPVRQEQKTYTPPSSPRPSGQTSSPIDTTARPVPVGSVSVDRLTQERIEKVRNRFNLSSDSEALRLLVSLGFEKFSEFQ